jgi:glycosyltransferase involved in cell wall biosynthesis
MKLSIIIPVYRVEGTLDRCIESVVGQDYGDMEIILVDDGSPDKCPHKCDDWARRHSCIRVIHKANGGLSDARNAALDIATGDYITFVDSDDYLSPSALLENMNVLATNPELDFIEYPILVHAGSEKEFMFSPQFQVYTDMDRYWLEGEAYRHTYACNKIFKRDIFNDLRFPLVPAFEDAHMLPKILDRCRCIATTNYGIYYYTWNTNGITVSADGIKIQSLLDAYIAILPRFSNSGNYMAEEFYLQALNIQMEAAAKGMPLSLPKIKHRMSISRRYSLKTNIKIIILNILGLKSLCSIYSLITNK